jgi:hypothetical protein
MGNEQPHLGGGHLACLGLVWTVADVTRPTKRNVRLNTIIPRVLVEFISDSDFRCKKRVSWIFNVFKRAISLE